MRKDPVFNYYCYGGTMVKRIDLKLAEQTYQCPHAWDTEGGFPACKTCNGKLEGTVPITIKYV
ncbi:MAG: hypothetical protein WC503_00920 [Candidatus Shapirobacteria bacterium]